MADDDLVLDLQWTVKSHGRVWVPQQKQVNGISFVALTKWDRRCVLAMSGQALDLRKDKEGGSLNCQAWQELLQLRQSEADKAVQEALKHEETDEKKLKKVQRARSKHDFLAPPIMHVFFKDKHISILYEGIQSSTIWVEANQETLRFLQKVFAESPKQPPAPKKPPKAKAPNKKAMWKGSHGSPTKRRRVHEAAE